MYVWLFWKFYLRCEHSKFLVINLQIFLNIYWIVGLVLNSCDTQYEVWLWINIYDKPVRYTSVYTENLLMWSNLSLRTSYTLFCIAVFNFPLGFSNSLFFFSYFFLLENRNINVNCYYIGKYMLIIHIYMYIYTLGCYAERIFE